MAAGLFLVPVALYALDEDITAAAVCGSSAEGVGPDPVRVYGQAVVVAFLDAWPFCKCWHNGQWGGGQAVATAALDPLRLLCPSTVRCFLIGRQRLFCACS